MLIVWKDDFAIDNGVIDEDHQFLIDHINTIIALLNGLAPVDDIIGTIRHLRIFAELHFQREERLQALAGYPAQEAHRAEHRQLLAQLDGILSQIATPSEDVAKAGYARIKSFMYRWILGHIIESDGKIRPFLKTIDSSSELPLVRIAA
jgi:hemerythrin